MMVRMPRVDVAELRLSRARDLMDREYARPLDVPALAAAALMSSAHFSRRFHETYGETPYAHLITRRIERTKAPLRRGDVSVTDACFAVGWSSLGSFSARFTEVVGETPNSYRDHNESTHGAELRGDGAWPAASGPRNRAGSKKHAAGNLVRISQA